MSLRIAGGTLALTGAAADLWLDRGQVAGGPVAGATELDATGLLVAPGLIDLQVNGAAGADLSAEPERLPEVAAALPAHGVTSFLPTLVTTGPDARERAMRALAAQGSPDAARPLGLHVEGPMLAPGRHGAHDPDLLRLPSPALVETWSPATGVAMVTIAPELPGALEVVDLLARRGVVVSLGHTAAALETMDAAAAAGATAVTHLFNAMPPLGHRDPGPVGAALSDPRLTAGLLVDGLHVHPRVVAAAAQALGHRLLLVSDTTAALGLPPGRAVLGGAEVVVGADGAVRLASDGVTLAGSAVGLGRCVRLLAEFTGCTAAQAVSAATTVPARLLGRPELARLAPGDPADVVLLDERLEVAATIRAGRPVFDRDGRCAEVPSWR